MTAKHLATVYIVMSVSVYITVYIHTFIQLAPSVTSSAIGVSQ